jgi:predicted outer membrane repeat protein
LALNQGVVVLVDAAIQTCSAANGGGIQAEGGASVNVTSSTFSGNTATTEGGAIRIMDGLLRVDGSSELTGNSAHGGGAIFSKGSAVVVEGEARVRSNAAYDGAGIYLFSFSTVTAPLNHPYFF